jgi:hypothetical protein
VGRRIYSYIGQQFKSIHTSSWCCSVSVPVHRPLESQHPLPTVQLTLYCTTHSFAALSSLNSKTPPSSLSPQDTILPPTSPPQPASLRCTPFFPSSPRASPSTAVAARGRPLLLLVVKSRRPLLLVVKPLRPLPQRQRRRRRRLLRPPLGHEPVPALPWLKLVLLDLIHPLVSLPHLHTHPHEARSPLPTDHITVLPYRQ